MQENKASIVGDDLLADMLHQMEVCHLHPVACVDL